MRTLQNLKPLIGKKADRLWKAYIFADTLEEKADIAQAVNFLADKLLNTFEIEQINLIPPHKGAASGKYRIGKIKYGTDSETQPDFSLTETDWIKHVGVFGCTGSGKTTLVYGLLKQLVQKEKPFLLLDWKRDYRDLLKLPEFKDKILIFSVGRNVSPFRFNPKDKPPGVDDHVWLKKLMEIISHAYLLGPGAMDVIQENMRHETFSEMQETLNRQKKRARELLWWASAKRTLNAINFPGLSEVVNAPSFDIPKLLNRQVILELDGLSDSDKVFLIGSLLMWIYYYRLVQPEREVWKHTIILEEAHHLLLKQPVSVQENYADVLMREIRVLGESIIVLDQRPSKISESALGNLNTKISLNLNLAQDTSAMAKCMLLEKDQTRFIGMLPIGQGIVKSHRITLPFLVELSDFKIKKGVVSDYDVKKYMRQFSGFSGPISTPLPEKSSIQGFPGDETPPSPLAKILLQHIAEHPFIPISKRYKQLGLSNALGNQAKEEIMNKSLAEPCTINGIVLMDFTQKGRSLVNRWGAVHKVRGGVEHNFWLDQIKELYKKQQGFTLLEKDNIDLVVISLKGNKETITAIQVETGKSNMKHNIDRLKQYRADHKFIIATNRQTALKLKNLNDCADITDCHVKDFLKSHQI